ncbi:MAG: hypothetical protein FJ319_04925 [SAR202 cluster bacterium]|nr:hypothetical protein [SAR202 cluster bacterium]
MTWATWRQYRIELIIALAVIGWLTAFIIPAGASLVTRFEDSGLAACLRSDGLSGCGTLAQRFIDSYRDFSTVTMWLEFLPSAAGVLAAAPIIMEIEQRTYRMAWTQSVTRGRWIATKLALALVGIAVFSAAYAAMKGWFYSPLLRVDEPFNRTFGATSVVPFAYAIFCFGVALAAGVLSRRTIPAMLVMVILYFVARVFVGDVLRPAFTAPLEVRQPMFTGEMLSPRPEVIPERSWIVSISMVDKSGQIVEQAEIDQIDATCGRMEKGMTEKEISAAFLACLGDREYTQRFTYHPPDRLVKFQAMESGIYVGAAAALLALVVGLVVRRAR